MLTDSQPVRRIGVFGSTGTIGKQTLAVIDHYPQWFELSILVGGSNVDVLIEQAVTYRPRVVAIYRRDAVERLRSALAGVCEVCCGEREIEQLAASSYYDVMVAAISGSTALLPVWRAVESGKIIALANKEAMVMAGKWLMEHIRRHRATVIPVDSEHAGVFQCLQGEPLPYDHIITQITLTASGGPFHGKKKNYLEYVRKDHALAHPVWKMGHKITIDSATLMNKGLELIEARWLFDVAPPKITAVVHPDCIVHSFVSFVDGSIKAQMAQSDMKIPIMNALSYPYKLPYPFGQPLQVTQVENLRFYPVDEKTFQCFYIARQVLLADKNTLSCILNAANEVAVQAFLNEKIGFLSIAAVTEQVLARLSAYPDPQNLGDLLELDRRARFEAEVVMRSYMR